ncbi:MAG: AtpZ/AtpI family protein [Clostridiales bacterium]|nr:AtpZ/AtpI family protein [Clostridiales bacterium]
MKYSKKVLLCMTLILQFGLNMVVPIILCTMLGVWLGKRYDMPLIVAPLFIVGALAGFTNIYKMATKVYKSKEETKGDYVKKNK